MRVKGDEHYVNMKREKSKEREKEKYFLRCARSLLSSAPVSSFQNANASLVCVLVIGLDGTSQRSL